MILKDLFNLANKRKERKRAAKNTAIGLSLGAIAGAVAGLLFAPKKGSETREDIANGAKKVANDAKKVANDVKVHAEESFENIKSKVKGFDCCGKKHEEIQVIEDVKEVVTTEETTDENSKKFKK
jgi:gas vesicle protein